LWYEKIVLRGRKEEGGKRVPEDRGSAFCCSRGSSLIALNSNELKYDSFGGLDKGKGSGSFFEERGEEGKQEEKDLSN